MTVLFRSHIERINFVNWATAKNPSFTLSREAYTQAKWDWRKILRQDPDLRHHVKQTA